MPRPKSTDSRAWPCRFVRRHAGGLIVAAIVVQLGTAEATAGMMRIGTGLFGTTEVSSGDISPFRQWRDVLARYRGSAKRTAAAEPCAQPQGADCRVAEWRNFLAGLKGLDRRRQIEAVNRRINQRRYIDDPNNYGIADYWAAPAEFLTRGGDCEDFAIAKFLSLRALGFDNSMLRIVVLRDTERQIDHAVLVVYQDGERLVLDNQVAAILPDRIIRSYRPIFSINETNWWFHRSS
jgi:predicted transglutaminase-like cysteine proteinase